MERGKKNNNINSFPVIVCARARARLTVARPRHGPIVRVWRETTALFSFFFARRLHTTSSSGPGHERTGAGTGVFVVVQIIIARCVCRVLYVRRVNISYRPKRTYGFRLHLFLFFSFFCFFFCRYSWVSPCNSVRWLFCFFYKQISSPLDRVNIFFSLYTIAFSLSSRHRFPLFH